MKSYIITIFTENKVGLLARITAAFYRRHINIESLAVSETEKKGISRFCIGVSVSEDMVRKIVQQINKVIEVIHAEYHESFEMIVHQMALFKIDLVNEKRIPAIEALAVQGNARILTRTQKFMIIEKTGTRNALEAFLKDLQAHGETEYARSGKIAMLPEGVRLNEILPKLADLNKYPAGYKMEVEYR